MAVRRAREAFLPPVPLRRRAAAGVVLGLRVRRVLMAILDTGDPGRRLLVKRSGRGACLVLIKAPQLHGTPRRVIRHPGIRLRRIQRRDTPRRRPLLGQRRHPVGGMRQRVVAVIRVAADPDIAASFQSSVFRPFISIPSLRARSTSCLALGSGPIFFGGPRGGRFQSWRIGLHRPQVAFDRSGRALIGFRKHQNQQRNPVEVHL